jgi:hypothetical protein
MILNLEKFYHEKVIKFIKLYDILRWLLALYLWIEQVIEGCTVIYTIAAVLTSLWTNVLVSETSPTS